MGVIWKEAEKKRTKFSSVSNAKLTLKARVFCGWDFCFVLHRNCNNFALFRVLAFQGTNKIQ